jgi:hypothetical protein
MYEVWYVGGLRPPVCPRSAVFPYLRVSETSDVSGELIQAGSTYQYRFTVCRSRWLTLLRLLDLFSP